MGNRERDGWDEAWSRATIDDELGTLSYPWVQPSLDFIARYVPPRSRVLEAGCGLGRFLYWLTDRRCLPVGVDISRGGLGAIHERWPDYRIAQADVRHLPFANDAFDACLSLGVIEHFPEGPAACLAEMRRVLGRDGVLVLCVPHAGVIDRLRGPLHRAYRALRRMRALEPPEPPGRLYGVGELAQGLEASGFELLESLPFGHAYAFHSLCRSFRRQGAYHDVTPLALKLGGLMQRLAPQAGASVIFIAARKRSPAGL